jgi:hypothetical protein
MTRNYTLGGNAVSRPVAFHPPGLGELKDGLLQASKWGALPHYLPTVAKFGAPLVGLAGMIYLALRSLCKARKEDSELLEPARAASIPHLLTIALLSYLGLLVFSMAFVEEGIRLNEERLMSPLHTLALSAAVPVAYWFLSRTRMKPASMAVAVAATLIMLNIGKHNLAATVPWAFARSTDGAQYTSRAWKESEIMQKVRALPPGIAIWSNASDALEFLTGRLSYRIPSKVVAGSNRPVEDFGFQMRKFEQDLRTKNGVVVYVSAVDWRWNLPSEVELVARLGLKAVDKSPDGRIYVAVK